MFIEVQDVDPLDVWTLKKELLLVDVRQEDEFFGELGHIPGSQLIQLDQLQDHLKDLPKNQTIVFICRSGARSAHASYQAQLYGLKNTFNMLGGMLLWNKNNLETER
jgi:rhodanese-related sulfurtransferase